MRHIRRRGPALAMVSGLAAGSMLLGASQAAQAATMEDGARPHRSAAATTGPSKDQARHETHTVARGNTLWEIADRHYGDGMKWWAVFGANAKAIEKTARDHGRKGSGTGHWIFPETELAIPAPAAVKAGEKAVRATLEHVLTQHPHLLGSSLCPEAQTPENMDECFLGLLDRVPLLLDQAPLLLDQVPLLLDRIDVLEEVSSDELLELVEPLITCVTEEDPTACLTEAIANPPAQE